MKDGDERLLDRRMVGVRRHDIGHMSPPALHHGMARQVRHAIARRPPEHTEKDAGHPVMKRWWAHMADIMTTNTDNSPVESPLVTVFHMA